MSQTPSTHLLDQVAERVDLLLQRYALLQRTNSMLSEQVYALSQERDSLQSRLSAARQRIDTLVERLPAASAPPSPPAKDVE